MLLHSGDTRRTTHEQHLVKLGRRHARIAQRLVDRPARTLHQISRHALELRTRDLCLQMDGLACVLRQKRQVDSSACRGRKFLFSLNSSLAHALHSLCVKLGAGVLLLELLYQMVGQTLVKIIAAKVVVTAGGQDLDDVVAYAYDAHVKGAAAQVVDHDLLRMAVV